MQQHTYNDHNQVKYLLQQAFQYLNIGVENVFSKESSDDSYSFLQLLQRLLQRLLTISDTNTLNNDFMEGLYQAESLARLAADVIFLEIETSDKVNYLSYLRILLSEIRELQEKKMLNYESGKVAELI